MKVIAFNGSPRKDGNTGTMLSKVLEGAAEAGAETMLVHLNELDMKGCQACMACRENLGTCFYKDEFQPFYDDLKDSDAVVMGTPIYMLQVTGQMKIFLDRFYCFIGEEPDPHTGEPIIEIVFPKGKRFAIVTSQGNADAAAYSSVVDYLKGLLSYLEPACIHTLVQAGTEDEDSARKDDDLLARAKEMGKQLVS